MPTLCAVGVLTEQGCCFSGQTLLLNSKFFQHGLGQFLTSGTLGSEHIALHSSDISLLVGPGESGLGKTGDLTHIAKLGQTGIVHQHGAAGITPQDRHQLLSDRKSVV